jgi:hypothetical protein
MNDLTAIAQHVQEEGIREHPGQDIDDRRVAWRVIYPPPTTATARKQGVQTSSHVAEVLVLLDPLPHKPIMIRDPGGAICSFCMALTVEMDEEV